MTWKLLKLVLFGRHCPNYYMSWNPGEESCDGRLRLRLVLLQMYAGDFWEPTFVCDTCGCQWTRLPR